MATTYLTYPVLDLLPTREDSRKEPWELAMHRVEAASGVFYDATHGSPIASTQSVTFRWTTLADYQALDSFLNTVLGRFSACWVPHWQLDFGIVSTGPLIVRSWGYAQLQPTLATQHLAGFHWSGGALTCGTARCTGVTSNGNGTETLTTSGTDKAGDQTVFSDSTSALMLLLYGRLADDRVEETWMTPTLGELTLRFVTLPGESP